MKRPVRGRQESPRREQGAVQSRTRLGDRLSSYLAHHRAVAADSLQRLWRTPLPSLMTWLVIGIALALPTGLLVSLANLEQLSRNWDGAAQISLFLTRTASSADSERLLRELRVRDDIAGVEYISAEQALAEFQQFSGYGRVLESLESNPLPAVIVVRPREQALSAASTARLQAELEQLAEVDRAVLDLEWVQRLYALMDLGQRLALALAALLAVGVLLVIGNTIRLAIESRRDEILVVKLVGGTNAFVRRPFLYTGIWYGLGGGLIAWLIVLMALWLLGEPVATLAGLYRSDFSLSGLGIANSLLLLGGSALLGLLGAWLAVGRHLDAIEPR